MISRTVGAEGIAQKSLIQLKKCILSKLKSTRARDPERLFSAAFECDFLVGLEHALSSCADPRATSNQAGVRCSGPASANFFLVDPSLLSLPPSIHLAEIDSLGDSLRHSEGKEITSLYPRIGSDGP